MKYTQEQMEAVAKILSEGVPRREAARQILGKDSKESTIRSWQSSGKLDSFLTDDLSEKKTLARILVLDVEVSASVVLAFNMFKHFSTPDHIVEFPYMLTWAAAWLEDLNDVFGNKLTDFPIFKEDHKTDYFLIQTLWKYLDETDIVVIHNGSFDSGWFNQRCAYHGFPPPSPYKVICTLKALKKNFSLPSNSLDYATRYFGIPYKKKKHEGITLWDRCRLGEVKAFDEMFDYNKGDIPTCGELYKKIRPFIHNHPNLGLYSDMEIPRCNTCLSENLEELDSKAYTGVSVFESVRCMDCGKVQRKSTPLNSKEQRKNLLRNVTN